MLLNSSLECPNEHRFISTWRWPPRCNTRCRHPARERPTPYAIVQRTARPSLNGRHSPSVLPSPPPIKQNVSSSSATLHLTPTLEVLNDPRGVCLITRDHSSRSFYAKRRLFCLMPQPSGRNPCRISMPRRQKGLGVSGRRALSITLSFIELSLTVDSCNHILASSRRTIARAAPMDRSTPLSTG